MVAQILLTGAGGTGEMGILAEAGIFTLTGQDVNLRLNRLAAAVGGFAVLGQSASLRATRGISDAAASFALSGQDANLRATRGMLDVAGNFALSGQAVSLRATRGISLAAASFALSGQDAALDFAGGSFSPTDIAGLKLWLKADGIVGLSDGDPIGTWADASGQGNDAAQATSSKKPTYKTGIVNSLPVVRTDGVDDEFTLPLNLAAGSWSFFAVVKESTGAPAALLNNTTPLLRISERSGNNGSSPAWYEGGWHEGGSATSSWQLLEWLLPAAGTGAVYRNGTSLFTASYTGSALNSGVFVLSAGGGSFFAGDAAEILLYDSSLGTTDRQSIETYLNTKYAIF